MIIVTMMIVRGDNLNRVPRVALLLVVLIEDLCPVGKLDAITIVILARLMDVALPARKKETDVLGMEHRVGQVPAGVVHQVGYSVPHGDSEGITSRKLDSWEGKGEVAVIPLRPGFSRSKFSVNSVLTW